MAVVRILHLVGSPTSGKYFDLSVLYASDCIDALYQPDKYEFLIALVRPDGLWRFPESLKPADIKAAKPVAFHTAVEQIAQAQIDVALPQMFCLAGMTTYRALLDVLGIAYLGNRPFQMALTADKAKTKAVVQAAGVRVPAGELVLKGQQPTTVVPAVVKPNHSDNSDGVTLVRHASEFAAALDAAFLFGDAALVEQYIPLGREVRCAIVVEAGVLRPLPLEEYFVDPVTRPVRTGADKLQRDEEGALVLAAKRASESWIIADDDPIVPAVWAAATACYHALGCEQYSLFDFRIDPDGVPWFLEAGLYCSYSPKSVVATMMAAAGTPLEEFFDQSLLQLLGTSSLRDVAPRRKAFTARL
jgi:D-alanine-D-alanine ligase